MLYTPVIVVVFSLVAFWRQGSAQESGGPFTGEGTYYGNGGGTGVCPASASEGNTLPTVAINAAQFGNSAACGACIKVHGTGTGAGENPISTTPSVVKVANVCPECNYGDLDFAKRADGRWDIVWSFVPCPGSSTSESQQTSSSQSKSKKADKQAEGSGRRLLGRHLASTSLKACPRRL